MIAMKPQVSLAQILTDYREELHDNNTPVPSNRRLATSDLIVAYDDLKGSPFEWGSGRAYLTQRGEQVIESAVSRFEELEPVARFALLLYIGRGHAGSHRCFTRYGDEQNDDFIFLPEANQWGWVADPRCFWAAEDSDEYDWYGETDWDQMEWEEQQADEELRDQAEWEAWDEGVTAGWEQWSWEQEADTPSAGELWREYRDAQAQSWDDYIVANWKDEKATRQALGFK